MQSLPSWKKPSGSLEDPDIETSPTPAVPENSAVGESASNGRAERTVQEVEDLLRVHKLALEAHIGVQIPSRHPVVRWLVEHVADILSKLKVNSTGQSPYEELHGKRAQERRAAFGERVFYYTPKKSRAKLDKRWKLGVYLGHAANSNEAFVGIKNGNVVKARGIARVVEGSRWNKDLVLKIIGVPGVMQPIPE